MIDRPEWTGDAMAFAKAHVELGVLRVDSRGRIWREMFWSFGRWRAVNDMRRAENVGGKGYLRISLAKPGGGLAIVMAHNLVYEVLVGPIPEGLELDHKNTLKHDNRPSNLEPVTQAINTQRAYENGRARPWSSAAADEWRPGQPRLTSAEIAEIRSMRADGKRLRDIADRFDISVSHAHRISSRG